MEKDELILKAFAKHVVENRIPSELENINNPIYTALSERLDMPKRDIFVVILEMQPRVLAKKYRYVI